MRTRVKMCGCTSIDDASLAVEAGADAVGVILAPSPRRVNLTHARAIATSLPPYVSLIGVFVDPTSDELIAATSAIPRMRAQFSGHESPALCALAGTGYVKVVHVDEGDGWLDAVERYPGVAMLDTAATVAGGSGVTFRWERVAALAQRRRTIIAGGLTPENVGRCITTVRPFAVDVRSGIESGGVKDHAKMKAFVRAVREADAQA